MRKQPKRSVDKLTALRVKYALEVRGHTLTSLAFKLNVSRALVSQVISTPKKSTPVRQAIADALDFHP